MWFSTPTSNARDMDAICPDLILQRWNVVQHELLGKLQDELGALTPKLEKLVHTLEWVRIEEFVASGGSGMGRPPCERAWLANAFVAKAVLSLTTTIGLIERLTIDRALRRICGFALNKKLPSEATFSRAFDEFARQRLAERVHEALIKDTLGEQLIGHLSRDGTAIVARERPAKADSASAAKPPATTAQAGLIPEAQPATPSAATSPSAAEPKDKSSIELQRKQSLAQMLEEIPTRCDRGTKCNAQGYKTSWNGYKLHLDTADCGVPISALLSSASMHDCLAAVPLSLISAQRVTHLYDVMDAAYCSAQLQAHCRELGHVPLIDHNRRNGQKEEFEPADAVRYHERTAAERTNARLKDEFGARHITVQGPLKVMSHLMFGVLALAADQLMRLRR